MNPRVLQSSDLVACLNSASLALLRGDAESARLRLLRTAGLLYRAARSNGAERQQRLLLADRFRQHAERIGRVLPVPPALPPRRDSDGPEGAAPLPEPVPALRFADVIGQEGVKSVFQARFLYPLQDPACAARYRQSGGGGALLFGPPGTGKTFLVRALAGELGARVFSIKPADILSKWVGESEQRLAAVFAAARESPGPSLVFIDEVDALGAARGDASAAPATRLLTQLLTELDGFDRDEQARVIFIGATNRPWDVDPALLRVGRLDALCHVDLPNTPAREALLRAALDGVPRVAPLDLRAEAMALEGYSAKEVCMVGELAAERAFVEEMEQGGGRKVGPAHLAKARERVHRAATPEMLARYRQFGIDHGLPVVQSLPAPVPPSAPRALAPARFDPLRFVYARDLAADIELLPFVCYALQHVGVNLIRRLEIHNHGAEESQNLIVEVSLLPDDFGNPWTANIPELNANRSWQAENVALPLRLSRLRAVSEREMATVRLVVRDKEQVLLARTQEVPILAYNEWIFLPDFLEITAAFVQPNSPALHGVIEHAARRLQAACGSASLCGYQRRDPDHVRQMLAAVHDALREDSAIHYINPPPSFERTGQKVRLVADTLAQHRGTCFDLAILQAALWEHIGLHPMIVLVPGHALLACWLDEQLSPAAVVGLHRAGVEATRLATALASGDLLLVNSVEIAEGASFAQAQAAGQAIVEQVLARGGSVDCIDIVAARTRVTPLP